MESSFIGMLQTAGHTLALARWLHCFVFFLTGLLKFLNSCHIYCPVYLHWIEPLHQTIYAMKLYCNSYSTILLMQSQIIYNSLWKSYKKFAIFYGQKKTFLASYIHPQPSWTEQKSYWIISNFGFDWSMQCEIGHIWTRDVNNCVLISQQITAPSSTPLIDAVTPSPGTPNAVGVLTDSNDGKIDSS